MQSARAYLRKNTGALHDDVDAMFSKLDLTKRADFSTFLQCHHLAITRLSAVWTRPDLIELDRLVAALQSDLRVLGCASISPVSAPPPVLRNDLGAAYVLAGSHFGKAILTRRWETSQDAEVKQAGQFLHSDTLKQAWTPTLAALEGLSEARLADVASSACDTFSLYLSAFGELDARPAQNAQKEFTPRA